LIHDMMLDCVERRFDAVRAPQPVQWLAGKGSAYAAAETKFAAVLHHAGPQPRERRRL
jgi:hypothetical protein